MIIQYPQEKITLTHKITGLKVYVDENTTVAKWLDDKWTTDKKPTQTRLFLK